MEKLIKRLESLFQLLEYCTDKLELPFAARRVFLEDGVEVFDEKDIPVNAEVYISLGENYKDPYASTKSKEQCVLGEFLIRNVFKNVFLEISNFRKG